MTCVIALFVMLTFAVFAYSNEPLSAGSEIINVIKLLEIANGDENGNMNYDKEVTRAEFVKMAINASTNKEAAVITDNNFFIEIPHFFIYLYARRFLVR